MDNKNKKEWLVLIASYLLIVVIGFLLTQDEGIYYDDLPPDYEPFVAME